MSDENGREFGNEPETLEFPCDPDKLPTSSELPLGDILVAIKSIDVELSKPNTTGERNRRGELKVGEKKMVKVLFTLAEPEELAGIPYTHRFLIGSDTDPKALKEGTWVRNGTLLMKMFAESSTGGKTFAEKRVAAVDQLVGATVKVEKSKDDRYADKNVIRAFWRPGTKVVKVIEKDLTSDVDAALPPLANGRDYASND